METKNRNYCLRIYGLGFLGLGFRISASGFRGYLGQDPIKVMCGTSKISESVGNME